MRRNQWPHFLNLLRSFCKKLKGMEVGERSQDWAREYGELSATNQEWLPTKMVAKQLTMNARYLEEVRHLIGERGQ